VQVQGKLGQGGQDEHDRQHDPAREDQALARLAPFSHEHDHGQGGLHQHENGHQPIRVDQHGSTGAICGSGACAS
jgi:hypothetical protein